MEDKLSRRGVNKGSARVYAYVCFDALFEAKRCLIGMYNNNRLKEPENSPVMQKKSMERCGSQKVIQDSFPIADSHEFMMKIKVSISRMIHY